MANVPGFGCALEGNVILKEIYKSTDEQGETALLSSRFVCTTNHGFAPYAQEELRRMFGSVKSTILLPGEIFLATLPADASEAVGTITGQPPMFLRHLFPVHFQEEGTDLAQVLERLVAFIRNRRELIDQRVSLQVRKGADSSWTESAGALKQALSDQISDLPMELTVQGAEVIVSVYADKDTWYAGVSEPQDNLSDWSGGAVRFQKEDGQISRAKFKLLEAEATFGIDFSAFHQGLDIGAAPGGWTSFLLERGLKVTAVDPAKMEPSLMKYANLTFCVKMRVRSNSKKIHSICWSVI